MREGEEGPVAVNLAPKRQLKQEQVDSPSTGARGNRKRSYWAVDALADKGGKYRNALGGTRIANFSLIGTEDWEDYFSLVLRAMLLETAADSDARLEKLETLAQSQLDELRRIADALEKRD